MTSTVTQLVTEAKTLEQKIVAEYGVVKGTLSVHPYLSFLAALLLGVLVGHFV